MADTATATQANLIVDDESLAEEVINPQNTQLTSETG